MARRGQRCCRLFQQRAGMYRGCRHRVRPDLPQQHRVIEPPRGDRLPAGARARPPPARPLTRPDSSSALTCASAMLNLMCGASKERVATVYPASATATASAVRPASADMAASAQAISAPTMAGRSSSARFSEASVAASGRSIANQYTVRKASIQLRACACCGARRVVDDLFRPRRVGERPQHVAGPQKRESARGPCRSTR